MSEKADDRPASHWLRVGPKLLAACKAASKAIAKHGDGRLPHTLSILQSVIVEAEEIEP